MKLLDAVYYNGGKGPSDGNNYWRRFTAAHYAIVSALLALFGLWLGLLLTALLGGYGVTEAPGALLSRSRPPLLLVAATALVFCLWFATGRAWIAALALSVPLTAAALILRPELNAPVGGAPVPMPPTLGEIALIAVTCVLCPALLALLAQGHLRSVKVRVIGALASFVVAAAAVSFAVLRG